MASRGSEVLEELAKTVGEAVAFYDRLQPDGRDLSTSERVEAQTQLESCTVALRRIHPDRDLLQLFADEGRRVGRDRDARPSVSVAGIVQRNLTLVLSTSPDRRAQAVTAEELSKFVPPIYDFWRHVNENVEDR
jgi:hypothetical protein